MKALVISKPIYDFILPLNEFPLDGDNFFIDSSIKSLSGIGSLTAILFSRYGLDTSFTGMIGEDDIGNKVKKIFNDNKVDTTYIETSYTEQTSINHKIYNIKTKKFTNIEEKSLKTGLMKFKYEFNPDVIIMDDGDYEANMAAINNYPNAFLIYYGTKYTSASNVYANKCKYVISNINFASGITGVQNGLSKPKNMVSLFQKYIDLYSSNLIIVLDNYDVLYYIGDEVRLIKNTNNNLLNKKELYCSLLSYFLVISNNVEESIKYTNKAITYLKEDLDLIKCIPEYNDIYNLVQDISKLKIDTVNNTDTINEVEITKIDNDKIEEFNNDNNIEMPNINNNENKGDNNNE